MQNNYHLKLDNIRHTLNISQWFARIALVLSIWVATGHIIDKEWMYSYVGVGTSLETALILLIMSAIVVNASFRIRKNDKKCYPSIIIIIWGLLILLFPELSLWFNNFLNETVFHSNINYAITGFNSKLSIIGLAVVFALRPYGYLLFRACLALLITYIPVITLFGFIDNHSNLINQMSIYTACIIFFLSWSVVLRQTHRPELRPILIDTKITRLFTIAIGIKCLSPLIVLAIWIHSHPNQLSADVILGIVAFIYLVLITTVYAMIRVSYVTRDARRLTNELHRQANTDELTQVNNRSGFMRKHNHQKPLVGSIILCDIDHFKKINDTYGHAAGDEVLKAFANVLKQNLRPNDQLIRWGGEEFLILTDTTSENDLELLAERLRYSIENTPCSYKDHIIHMTASFGIRVMLPNEKLNHGIKYADQNLYFAKGLGRNCVVLDNNVGFEKSINELIKLHKQIYGNNITKNRLIERFKIYDQTILIEQLTRYRKLAQIQNKIAETKVERAIK